MFLDREELPASPSLTSSLADALQSSAALVVVCSPSAVQSTHVDLEIREFKRAGRASRVFALVVDGDPADTSRNCFPVALVHNVDSSGHILDETTEPLAADVRAEADGQHAAKLKVLAGLLQVDYAELTRRQERAETSRAWRRRLLAGTLASLILLASMGGAIALAQRYQAQVTESRLLAGQAQERVQSGDVAAALRLSLSALPEARGTGPEWFKALWNRPWVNEAEAALYRAVQIARHQTVLRAGDAQVSSLAFNHDGSRLAAGSRDGVVRLWSLAVTVAPTLLTGHEHEVDGITFDRTGARVLTTSRDGSARLWESATGRLVAALEGHADPIATALFSPDGATIATASEDNTVRLWQADDGAPLWVLRGHGAEILSEPGRRRAWDRPSIDAVAFNRDGSLIATGGRDGAVMVWSVRSGARTRRLTGHSLRIQEVGFTNDSRNVIATDGSTILTWDVATGKQLRELQLDRSRVPLAQSSLVAMPPRLWDTESRSLEPRFVRTALAGATQPHAISPDGSIAVVASEEGFARAWSVADGQLRATLSGHSTRIDRFAFDFTGSHLATAANDGSVRIWDLTEDRALRRIESSDIREECRAWACDLQSLRVASDGKRFMVLGGFVASVREVATGEEWFRVRTHCPDEAGERCAVTSGTFSPDGATLAVGGEDTIVRLWDVDTRKETVTWSASCRDRRSEFRCTVDALRWSRDGSVIATASMADGTGRLWEARSGRALATFDHAPDNVQGIEIDPMGSRVLTYTRLKKVRLWDRTGNRLAEWNAHAGVFAPLGHRLAIEASGTISVLDSTSGNISLSLGTRDMRLSQARFSPDGRSILAWSQPEADSRLRRGVYVWDVESGHQRLFVPEESRSPIGARVAEFSSDSKRIAMSDGSATYLWDVNSSLRLAQIAGGSSDVAFAPNGREIVLISQRSVIISSLLPSRFDLLRVARLRLPSTIGPAAQP